MRRFSFWVGIILIERSVSTPLHQIETPGETNPNAPRILCIFMLDFAIPRYDYRLAMQSMRI
jgi:hypothetical protein